LQFEKRVRVLVCRTVAFVLAGTRAKARDYKLERNKG
jgi:hypothetical protein